MDLNKRKKETSGWGGRRAAGVAPELGFQYLISCISRRSNNSNAPMFQVPSSSFPSIIFLVNFSIFWGNFWYHKIGKLDKEKMLEMT
jgi:hypothetical protein